MWLLCSFEGPPEARSLAFSGGFSEGETPLPIPNRAVKPLSADGTWPARAWESRTPPVFLHRLPLARPQRCGLAASPTRSAVARQCGAGACASVQSRAERRRRGTGRRVRPARTARDGEDARERSASLAAAPGEGAPGAALAPGRPPSRLRCRTRATGRSAACEAHRARAAGLLMSAMWGTCVRKVRARPDG